MQDIEAAISAIAWEIVSGWFKRKDKSEPAKPVAYDFEHRTVSAFELATVPEKIERNCDNCAHQMIDKIFDDAAKQRQFARCAVSSAPYIKGIVHCSTAEQFPSTKTWCGIRKVLFTPRIKNKTFETHPPEMYSWK